MGQAYSNIKCLPIGRSYWFLQKIYSFIFRYSTDKLLTNAIKQRDANSVKQLLEDGANPNGETCSRPHLISAIIYTNEKIVELLLKYDANIQIGNYYFKTPIHFATYVYGQTYYSRRIIENIIILLVEYGANVNEYNNYLKTILHCAIPIENPVFIQMLLDFGADVNLEDRTSNKYTPLQIAISGQNDVCKSILLMHTIQLMNSKQYVSQKNVQCLNSVIHDWEVKFRNMMKELVHPNYTVSLYDLLSKNLFELMMSLRNEVLRKTLKTSNFIEKFPEYANVLNYRITKGIERIDLFDKAHQVLRLILNQVHPLPVLCTEKIMKYLNLFDMQCILK